MSNTGFPLASAGIMGGLGLPGLISIDEEGEPTALGMKLARRVPDPSARPTMQFSRPSGEPAQLGGEMLPSGRGLLTDVGPPNLGGQVLPEGPPTKLRRTKAGYLVPMALSMLRGIGYGLAANSEPTRALGGGSFGASVARGFGGASQGLRQEDVMRYRLGLESQDRELRRMQLERSLQHEAALENRWNQMGDATGRRLDLMEDRLNRPTSRLITSGPMGGFNVTTQDGRETVSPGTMALPLPELLSPGATPSLSLPSVFAQQQGVKDTKPKPQMFTTRDAMGNESPALIDSNPDSPTFGQVLRRPRGVSRAPLLDRAGARADKATARDAQIETAADFALHNFGNDPDKALQFITGGSLPPDLKAAVRNRIREIARPGKTGRKASALDQLIQNATQGAQQ